MTTIKFTLFIVIKDKFWSQHLDSVDPTFPPRAVSSRLVDVSKRTSSSACAMETTTKNEQVLNESLKDLSVTLVACSDNI